MWALAAAGLVPGSRARTHLGRGAMRWTAKARAVMQAGASFRLALADNGTIHAETPVGADGAWSRGRPIVTSARPSRSGLSFVESRLRAARMRHPVRMRAVGDGTTFAAGGRPGFVAHREPDNEICAHAAFGPPEDLGAASLPSRRCARLASWHPDLLLLIADNTPSVVQSIHALL